MDAIIVLDGYAHIWIKTFKYYPHMASSFQCLSPYWLFWQSEWKQKGFVYSHLPNSTSASNYEKTSSFLLSSLEKRQIQRTPIVIRVTSRVACPVTFGISFNLYFTSAFHVLMTSSLRACVLLNKWLGTVNGEIQHLMESQPSEIDKLLV